MACGQHSGPSSLVEPGRNKEHILGCSLLKEHPLQVLIYSKMNQKQEITITTERCVCV